MAPNFRDSNGVLFESDTETADLAILKTPIRQAGDHKIQYVWLNVIMLIYLHSIAVCGFYLALFSVQWKTNIFAFFLSVISILGITAGAHRLWSHKSYKAKWPLRLLLVVFNNMAFQGTIIGWSRDHRMHHKHSETDADPYNCTRGFFFSHIGWLVMRKHADVKRKGKSIDISDLYADPLLRFQKKYYWALVLLWCFIIPTVIPVYVWRESWMNAFFVASVSRYVLVLNIALMVNSFAHRWGNRPYDKYMQPCDNTSVSIFSLGEGFHNYHHTFPWDYKTAELSNNRLNFTTQFINFFAKLGWAYDLKTVSEDIIQKRVTRTGDGSHNLWGWGDKEQEQHERSAAIRINPRDD